MGFQPWSPDRYTFEIDQGDSFFQPDDVLGYKGRPGVFNLTLSDSLNVRVTHNEDGYRITSTPDDTLEKFGEVWIFGCSFTHGYGVNDDENYPWMLQEAFPYYRVRNFGMDGYGTYHSLLQLESMDSLWKHRVLMPRLIILAYGGFHDQRNVNNRYWKKALSGRDIAEGIAFPQLRYDDAGNLVPGMEKPEYHPWPLQRYSALSHFLENAANKSENDGLRTFDVTQSIILKMDSILPDAPGLNFLVANIFQSWESDQMLESIKSNVPTVDIAVDVEDSTLRILPNDGHPNKKGHRLMADKLIDYIRSNNLLPDPIRFEVPNP